MSIELTQAEKNCSSRDELVYYWLLNNTISFGKITNLYVKLIEKERINYKDMLSKSDVYVATLIDNDKEMIKKQIPFAIDYMLDNERLKGSKWYEKLRKIKEQ